MERGWDPPVLVHMDEGSRTAAHVSAGISTCLKIKTSWALSCETRGHTVCIQDPTC